MSDPIANTYPTKSPTISKQTHIIAGIKTIIYGLDEIPASATSISCLWLLHPRLSRQERMEPLAAISITEWNKHASRANKKTGLIAASFDQRNHGTREIDPLANEAWRGGNPRHAQDMFSSFHGTALDTSQLITYLPAYAFPTGAHTMSSHMVLGISLGGHAAWHCLLHDQRINTGIIVIGCADYVRLMSHRAEKSKLETWRSSDPAGAKFLGSKDFPPALLAATDAYDPAGLLMGEIVAAPSGSWDSTRKDEYLRSPSEREQRRLMPLMRDHLRGKRIFNLAGGSDKLVPYGASEPFLGWLKTAIAPGGWFDGRTQGTSLKDKVYEGVGHDMSSQMLKDAVDYIVETLDDSSADERAAKI